MDLISVLIADPRAVIRRRLGRFLSQQKDIQVVGEAANGRQVLNRVEAIQPHILLLDLQTPKMNGLDVLPKLRSKSPHTRILIHGDYFEEAFIARALQAGVHGCLLKAAPLTELVKVIRITHAGELWVQRRLLTQVVESLRHTVDELQGFSGKLRDVLSDREREVVIWVIQGMTNKEVAVQLGISAKTVKTHLQHVFRKMNVRRRIQLSALSPYLASSARNATPPALHWDRRT
jgi:DNA-binding NarL/FixJ family response regulator